MSTIIIRNGDLAIEQNSKGKRSAARPAAANVPLVEWTADEIWRRSAPAKLHRAWKRDPLGDGWLAWTEYLARRKTPAPVATLCHDLQPLVWGLAPNDPTGGFAEWRQSLQDCLAVKKPAALVHERVTGWLDFANSHEVDVGFALECLCWAHLLPKLAELLEAGIWWRLVEQLASIAAEARDQQPSEQPENVLRSHLLAGELPLALAYLFPEVRPLAALRKPARKVLGHGLEALTDGEGLPAGWTWPALPLLAACWTRSRAIGEKLKGGCWNKQAELQFEWFVRQVLRLTRSDGSLALSDAPREAWSPAMLSSMLRLAGDPSDRAAASQRKIGDASSAKRFSAKPPEPAVNSEWSGITVLAAGWDRTSPRVTVSYQGAQLRIEVEASGQLLFSGDWETTALVDDQPLAPAGNWEELCWYTDKDCHYLELAIDLAGGARLERQIVLPRHDQALYLADILLSRHGEPVPLQLISQLPLAAGIAIRDELDTRDALIVGQKPLAVVMPLALPEWRTDPRIGEMHVRAMKLTLDQKRRGVNLCAPLWFDLSPKRIKADRTWRQLTVGESLKLIGPDVAVAYRIQSGKDQWFVYRSLGPCANRTALGQNISHECLIGRFQKDGVVKEYFEIEA